MYNLSWSGPGRENQVMNCYLGAVSLPMENRYTANSDPISCVSWCILYILQQITSYFCCTFASPFWCILQSCEHLKVHPGKVTSSCDLKQILQQIAEQCTALVEQGEENKRHVQACFQINTCSVVSMWLLYLYIILLLFACWVIFHDFLLSAGLIQKLTFSNTSFRNHDYQRIKQIGSRYQDWVLSVLV